MSDVIRNNEKVHESYKDINYLFCERKGSDKLIITFPGFSNSGIFKYTYVRTLKDVNAHRLFVLDNFGFRGCYLLGEDRDFSVEKSVISLINQILQDYNIKKENVILQGSSKGGWISLYYGIKYGFGNVIAGGPQTKMGDFLIEHETDKSVVKVASYIAGGNDEKDKNYLNNLLYDLLKPKKNFPNIYIHIGKGDFHYPQHIQPFLMELESINADYKLDVQEYDSHRGLAWYYPEYLMETLNEIDPNIVDLEMYRSNEKFNLKKSKSNDVSIHIDRIFVHKSMISIKGWAILKDEDNEDYERYILLKMGKKIENFKVTKESRMDVAKHFDNPKYRYSGFTCRFNRDIFKKSFKIGILFKSKENPAEQYYNELRKKFTLN